MLPRISKVSPGIIIIGAGREGLAAATYFKSKTKLKYIIFPIECQEDAKGEHAKNLKIDEKVTYAQMNMKMDRWVVMTEKNDDPVTITEYTCQGLIIATGCPYNVPEWLKEKVSFDVKNKEDFVVDTLHCLGTKRICSIGFEEEDGLYRIKGGIKICHKKVHGRIIVGAGPAGLAAAATFDTSEGGPTDYIIIEKSDCIAPLWQHHTYDKLTLQRPKEKCQLLADKPFDKDCPTYPTRDDFLDYLRKIAENLKVQPQLNEEVTDAYYIEDTSDDHYGENSHWVVRTIKKKNKDDKFERSEYICKCLVVASGRDARPRVPEFAGLKKHFPRETNMQIHSSEYKNGKMYKGKNVLVIGYGDSAIDICGDLHNEGAFPYIVVRDVKRSRMVYKLAKFFPEKKQQATFPLTLNLSLLSVLVDNFGQCENGIINPKEAIEIQVYPAIEEFRKGSVKFKNVDTPLPIDRVILATGYSDNVQLWCQGKISFQEEPHELRVRELAESIKNGVFQIGFSKDGLSGIKGQAQLTAEFAKDEDW